MKVNDSMEQCPRVESDADRRGNERKNWRLNEERGRDDKYLWQWNVEARHNRYSRRRYKQLQPVIEPLTSVQARRGNWKSEMKQEDKVLENEKIKKRENKNDAC